MNNKISDPSQSIISPTDQNVNQEKQYSKEVGGISTAASKVLGGVGDSNLVIQAKRDDIPKPVGRKGLEWSEGVIANMVPISTYEKPYEIPKYSNNELTRASLIKLNLYTIDNLVKVQKILKDKDKDKAQKLIDILNRLNLSPIGPFQISQTCFDKLLKVIDLMDILRPDDHFDEEDEKGLINLAYTGLLTEENLDLYVVDPLAFEFINTDDILKEDIDDKYIKEAAYIKNRLEEVIEKLK